MQFLLATINIKTELNIQHKQLIEPYVTQLEKKSSGQELLNLDFKTQEQFLKMDTAENKQTFG